MRHVPSTRDLSAVREREREILRLRTEERLSFRAIGARLDMDPSQVHRIFQRVLSRDVPKTTAAEARAAELDMLEMLEREALVVLRTPHVLVQFGKVARGDDGKPLTDHGPTLAAVRELRALGERRARILGTDAPKQKVVEVITEELLDRTIAQLEAELGLESNNVVDAEVIDGPGTNGHVPA